MVDVIDLHDRREKDTMADYDYIKTGSDIYQRSFEIIRQEANLDRFPDDIEPAVVRVVHAAADPAIADLVAFTPHVAQATRKALQDGRPILCDSSMVATGIIRSRLPQDNEIICHIKDPRLADLAASRQMTKTAAAVDLWHESGLLDGAIIAIGNAPTSLFRLLELLDTVDARPAAVIGIPVGFVGAAESKDALINNSHELEYFTVQGRRGGSAMTVAAINAMASAAETTNIHSDTRH